MTEENNASIIEAWNTVLFDKFCRYKHLLVSGLAGHSNEALKRHAMAEGAKVLDVGCGFGDTTRLIAEQVGPSGRAVGVDCAENFIRYAEAAARDAEVKNVEFFVADVQIDDLKGPYSHAFSRFGTMFFMTPVAALRNIGKSLEPGGKMTMIVWRKREENPWLHRAELAVKAIVPVVSHDETDEVHCGPGPFSMAGPDMVSDMMSAAGFERITFERFDTDVCVGQDLDEAIEFAMTLGPAGEIIRLAGDEGQRLKPKVVEALRDALGGYASSEGVWAPSSTWFVSGVKAA